MNDEIRLLSIVTRMNVGGPAVQISTLMHGFKGTEVRQVLLTGKVGPDERDFLAERGQDLNFQRVPSLMRAIRPYKDLQALKSIAMQIVKIRPHVIHTHTAKAGGLGRLAAVLTGSRAKRIHTFHGHLLHGYFSPAGARRVIAIERYLARHTDRLITVGETVREDLLRAGIGKAHQYVVVPPGLSMADIPDKAAARQSLELSSSDKVVCFIGRLTPIKRIDRLLEVVEIVSREDPDVVFVIAGDGSESARVETARDRGLPIRPLGWRSDVERILAASDAMVLTSDNEGTPVSLIQAGLAGIPVVATNVGSVGNVVVDGKSGWLTSVDPEEISSKILQILKNREFAHSLGLFARANYEKRFGSETLIQAHIDLYHNVLNR
jgi:glycosyltransferase involved in cell wall biosynthesis